MNSKIRNMILASALATGLIGGGAIASAQTAATTSASSSVAPDSGTATTPADQGPRGPRSDEDRSARDQELATALNISVEQVTAAQQAAHDAVDAQLGEPTKPSGTPTEDDKAAMQARHDLFDQLFAEQLGITTDQLTAARVSAAQTHLAAEVASGKITQAQADEMLTRIQNGERPGPGGRGGPGGHGHDGPPAADAAPAAG
jgi:hypothetical protein